MIVIHIGLRKAGSSSIQTFLRDNDEALRTMSIDYPSLGQMRRFNHANLAVELLGREKFDPARGSLAGLAAYWRSADAEVMIVSAEMLEVCDSDQARRLGELRRAGDEEIRIVMLIRDLVGLTPSSYGQVTKTGLAVDDFDIFFRKRMRKRRVDYFETAEHWADAFGWEALRVRPLDPTHLLNGELIDDFLNQAGVDPAHPRVRAMHRPGAANVGPGWRVVEALRAMYDGRAGLPKDHALADAAKRPRKQRERIGRLAARLGETRGWNAERGRYLTRIQAQACLETYEASIMRLNRHLVSEVPFPSSLDARGFLARERLPDWSDIPPTDLRDFYDALGETANASESSRPMDRPARSR